MVSRLYKAQLLQTQTRYQMVISRLEKVLLSLINQKAHKNQEKVLLYFHVIKTKIKI
jgi:DNA-binding protein Fis